MNYSIIDIDRRGFIIDRRSCELYWTHTCFNAGFDGNIEYSMSDISTLFYTLLQAYAPSCAEMSNLEVFIENGEFRILSDKQIYLNDEISYIQALSDYFFVEHGSDSCEVRCRPTMKMSIDERVLREIEEIILDYTFAHPNQVIHWRDKTYKHRNGVGDLLQLFMPEAKVMYQEHLGGQHSITLAIAFTKDTRHHVLSYVNGRRFPKCNIEELYKDAILKHIPEAENGFRAVVETPLENLHFPLRTGYHPGIQFDILEEERKDIDRAVANFLYFERHYGTIWRNNT